MVDGLLIEGEEIRGHLISRTWPEVVVSQSDIRTQYKIQALKKTTTKLRVTGLQAEKGL
jgi:hypothetical protein